MYWYNFFNDDWLWLNIEGNKLMRQKISLLLAIIGIIVIAAAFALSGSTRLATITLGIILACGGCLMLITNGHVAEQHRTTTLMITILFVIVVVAYIIKILVFH